MDSFLLALSSQLWERADGPQSRAGISDTRLRPPVRPFGFVVAGAATVSVAALFWFFERELLWMVGVLAAGIWTPLAVRHEEAARRWALPWLVAGMVLLVGLGVVVWVT